MFKASRETEFSMKSQYFKTQCLLPYFMFCLIWWMKFHVVHCVYILNYTFWGQQTQKGLIRPYVVFVGKDSSEKRLTEFKIRRHVLDLTQHRGQHWVTRISQPYCLVACLSKFSHRDKNCLVLIASFVSKVNCSSKHVMSHISYDEILANFFQKQKIMQWVMKVGPTFTESWIISCKK